MNSLKKVSLAMFMLVVVVLGLALPGCSYLKNSNSKNLSREDKVLVAGIDRQEASGNVTATGAMLEKDSLTRDPIVQF